MVAADGFEKGPFRTRGARETVLRGRKGRRGRSPRRQRWQGASGQFARPCVRHAVYFDVDCLRPSNRRPLFDFIRTSKTRRGGVIYVVPGVRRQVRLMRRYARQQGASSPRATDVVDAPPPLTRPSSNSVLLLERRSMERLLQRAVASCFSSGDTKSAPCGRSRSGSYASCG